MEFVVQSVLTLNAWSSCLGRCCVHAHVTLGCLGAGGPGDLCGCVEMGRSGVSATELCGFWMCKMKWLFLSLTGAAASRGDAARAGEARDMAGRAGAPMWAGAMPAAEACLATCLLCFCIIDMVKPEFNIR